MSEGTYPGVTQCVVLVSTLHLVLSHSNGPWWAVQSNYTKDEDQLQLQSNELKGNCTVCSPVFNVFY